MFIEVELNDIIETSESINVYNNGEVTVYGVEDAAYNQIIEGWTVMTKNAHDMPAYGVSLNKETLKAMNSGLWVEFDFGKPTEYNGMPFEKLLVEVNKGFYGFNIIRYTKQNGYDGRCFYIDLVNKDMNDFYNVLVNI